MSLTLVMGSKPDGMEFKSWGGIVGMPDITLNIPDSQVEVSFTMDDFCAVIYYIMTNTDLKSNDPRFHLLRVLRSLFIVKGHNPNECRLSDSGDPVDAEGKKTGFEKGQ